MKLNRIAEKAKRAMDSGMDAVRPHVHSVREAAAGKESFGEKVRAAAGALRARGRGHETAQESGASQQPGSSETAPPPGAPGADDGAGAGGSGKPPHESPGAA